MSTQEHPTTTSAGYASPLESPASLHNRIRIIASALGLGAASVAAILLWNPWPARNEFGYEAIAPVRDGTWLGLTVDALGFATAAVALSLGVCLLARGRGAAWANVGSVVTMLGGVMFAMGAFAFAALSWYATETEAIPVDAGTTLMKFAVDNPAHIMALQMAGFMAYTLGTILLSVALLRAATVSRWMPITILVLTLAQFAPVPGRVLDLIQVALMAVLIAFAGLLIRALSPTR